MSRFYTANGYDAVLASWRIRGAAGTLRCHQSQTLTVGAFVDNESELSRYLPGDCRISLVISDQLMLKNINTSRPSGEELRIQL
jgi:hypothetical protein